MTVVIFLITSHGGTCGTLCDKFISSRGIPQRSIDPQARMARTRKLHIRLTDSDYRLLLEYQRDHGHGTKSAAARDMMRRQARYSHWKQARRGREILEEAMLRRIAQDILREYPEATYASLGWNMTKRAGRFVNVRLVKKIAAELTSSR